MSSLKQCAPRTKEARILFGEPVYIYIGEHFLGQHISEHAQLRSTFLNMPRFKILLQDMKTACALSLLPSARSCSTHLKSQNWRQEHFDRCSDCNIIKLERGWARHGDTDLSSLSRGRWITVSSRPAYITNSRTVRIT